MYSKILISGSSVYNSVFFSSECNSMPSKFIIRVVRSGALVYNSYFFSEQAFYGNYSTLDSEHAVEY